MTPYQENQLKKIKFLAESGMNESRGTSYSSWFLKILEELNDLERVRNWPYPSGTYPLETD